LLDPVDDIFGEDGLDIAVHLKTHYRGRILSRRRSRYRCPKASRNGKGRYYDGAHDEQKSPRSTEALHGCVV
jgi:hypothetical protein